MKLQEIQKNLKAPKGQTNSFGKYKYRSCEDILEAVKPLLGDSLLIISDDIVEVGGRVYVKASAVFTDGGDSTTVTAYAREAETKKGMDDSQITGSASSYARKYALNGLFLIDDTKDADTQDNRHVEQGTGPSVSVCKEILDKISLSESLPELKSVASGAQYLDAESKKAVTVAYKAKKAELEQK